jgi:hypothetical protein
MKKLLLGAIGFLIAISHSFAVVTIDPATNGVAISADTAADAATPSWTSLSPIVIHEGTNDVDRSDFVTAQDVTFVLKAPVGFEFNTAAPPDVFADGGLNPGGKTDLRQISVAMLDSMTIQITWTVTGSSGFDAVIIGGVSPVQVRPLSGTNLLAGGYIYRPTTDGGTAGVVGVVTTDNTRGIGGSNFGQLGVVGGAANHLAIDTQPSEVAVMDWEFGRQPVISIRDQFGNLSVNDSSTVVTATRNAGTGSLSGTTVMTAVNGLVTYTNLAATALSVITIDFTATLLGTVTSDPIDIQPEQPPVPVLIITQQPSSNAVAGVAFAQQPIITVEDQYGRPWTNDYAVTATRLAGNGTLQGTVTVNTTNSTATFTDLFHTVAGTITIEFSGSNTTAVVSTPITISPNVVDHLVFTTQPGGSVFGSPLSVQPALKIVDAYGNDSTVNLATNLEVSLAINTGTGSLVGTTTLDIGTLAGNGSVAFSGLSVDAAGEKTLIASAGDLGAVESDPFTISQNSQSITFGPIADQNISIGSFTLTASASSGLPVSFSVVSGNATISGDTITLTGVGLVTVRASQAGDDNYTAAEDVDQTFRITSGQTISFGPLSDRNIADGSFNVSATASSGLPVTFSVVSGNATISGSTVTPTGVGLVTIRASQAGDINYTAAPDVDQTFRFISGQTITFGALSDRNLADGSFEVSATASSGLSVTFSIVSGNATISGTTVTPTGVGLVTVRASQAGDADYTAAPDVDRTFRVISGQTITFDPLADRDITNSPFTLSATASSGLTVSFSVVSGPATIVGDSISLTGVGLVTVRASQAGNEDYTAAADVEQTFRVTSAQTITFGPIADRNIADGALTLSASASSGLPVSFSVVSGPATISGATVTFTNVGLVTVRASQAGDDNYYAAADVERTFRVISGQTITFDAIADRNLADGPLTLSATASSGLEVTFSIVDGPATLSGNTLTATNVGLVTVRASQAGNDNYLAAEDVDRTFRVIGGQTITFEALSDTDITNSPITLIASASSGLPITFTVVDGPATVSSNMLTLTNVGLVTVRASQAGNENYTAAEDVEQTFRVTSGQIITFETISDRDLNDSPFTVTATASSGLPVSFTIVEGPAIVVDDVVTLIDVGFVTIRASQEGNDNYNAAPDVDQTFHVTSGQTITFNTITNRTIGDAPITLSATASSGLPVTFEVISGPATLGEGNTLSLNAVGRVTVRASQAGNTNYAAAPSVTRKFLIRTGVFLASDFDEDGFVDVLIMNTNRSLTLLIMERTNLLEVVTLRQGIPIASGWNVVAQNDLDMDKKNDVVFQHTDGRLAVWTFHDTNFLSSRSLKADLPVLPGWRAKGMSDINGDSKGDIVFQRDDNTMAIWFMTTLTNQVGKYINGAQPINPGWTTVATRDMNDDNRGDIIFQHTDGRFAVWFMNGTNILSSGTMPTGPAASTGWKVAGMSDFDKDGNHDILWQTSTGSMAYWWMNNTTYLGVSGFKGYVLKNQSQAAGPR